MRRPLPPDLVEVTRAERNAAYFVRAASELLTRAAKIVRRRDHRDAIALAVGELRMLAIAIDPQCTHRDSGGARCERRLNHPPPCACPRAADRYAERRRGES